MRSRFKSFFNLNLNLIVPSGLGRLPNQLRLADRSSERRDPSAVVANILHLSHHWRADMPRIAGGNSTVPAYVGFLDFVGRTEMRTGFGDLPASRTGIDGRLFRS